MGALVLKRLPLLSPLFQNALYFGYNVKSSNSVEKLIDVYTLRKPNFRQKVRISKQFHSVENVKGGALWAF